MSFYCIHCHEAWDFEDYVCPCCGQCAVDPSSSHRVTLTYKFSKDKDGNKKYDVIRKSTKKSVFDEPSNYLNKEPTE